MIIHSIAQTISSISYTKEITLGAGEEIYEFAGFNGIVEVGDKASEGQAAGVYGGRFCSRISCRTKSLDRLGRGVLRLVQYIQLNRTYAYMKGKQKDYSQLRIT